MYKKNSMTLLKCPFLMKTFKTFVFLTKLMSHV